ncbi:MAG: tRNA (guanosine(37)-N1)-methyltransferase TrmD [Clostridium sp.]|nr:tRNA (guanosine(37)-N1)-methyltransferase TrmD [Clostridium sp.]MCM1398674.1 tRNA (guanosine(37)-N1)-methyltransferase TrmD [Clostridium sp.]MCM1458695.1 tRNA (guanosine(37)-N1)-methyltransferase TrmD [Bacteroides sp.]
MNFHILTLFPDMVLSGLRESITGRAIEKGLIHINAVNIRDFAGNKYGHVDDYTYGGGAGMLIQAEPVYQAYKSIEDKIMKPRVLYMTPQGNRFDQKMAEELSREQDIVLLCGHYEGIDERVLEMIVTDYVSIGDFVLTGGELPAMMIADAVSRLVPGVLGSDESAVYESFYDGLLEYPQYTRPEEFMGVKVPEVLLSGHHKNIEKWRHEQALLRTKERRPDLYEKYISEHGNK